MVLEEWGGRPVVVVLGLSSSSSLVSATGRAYPGLSCLPGSELEDQQDRRALVLVVV